MTTIQDRIDAVRGAIGKRPPFCSGVVSLDEKFSKLFYERQDETAGLLSLASATTAQLEDLNSACLPATFESDRRDAFDGPHIKARKLGVDHFMTNFNPHALDIVNTVRQDLVEGPNQNKPIEAELFELSVYDVGSFFKAHKDTPRNAKVFACVVISFPTPHQGGNLILRHEGEAYSFDSSKTETPSAACVAFYSDVEQEITTVTSGYRLTLTYNLLYGEEKKGDTGLNLGSPFVKDIRSISDLSVLRATILNLLQDDRVLPDGGYFGFGFRFTYPAFHPKQPDDSSDMSDSSDVSDSEPSGLQAVLNQLKGSDALLKQVCDTLSLSLTAQIVLDTDDHSLMLIPDLIDLSECQSEGGWEELVSDFGDGREVFKWENENDGNGDENNILWVTPRTAFPTFETTYILADYKRPSVEHLRGDICLVAKVGKVGKRDTTGASKSKRSTFLDSDSE